MYNYEDIILALTWYFQTDLFKDDEFLIEKKLIARNHDLSGTNIYETVSREIRTHEIRTPES